MLVWKRRSHASDPWVGFFPHCIPKRSRTPARGRCRVLVEQLPRRVEVFHSLNWLARSRHGTIQGGECDFVLVDRKRGVLFVEVKGGSLGAGVVEVLAWLAAKKLDASVERGPAECFRLPVSLDTGLFGLDGPTVLI